MNSGNDHTTRNYFRENWQLVIILLVIMLVTLIKNFTALTQKNTTAISVADSSWAAPSLYYDEIEGEERKLVAYGQDLIAHTSKYLGPHGSVAQISNGMNCQNCHLNAGKKKWGNNYSAVFSTYPRFRDRSGTVETIYKRVSDCLERSLNGSALDSNSKEYQAIYNYIKWVGKNVKKNEKPVASGITKLPLLDRAADPIKGKQLYAAQCARCHGTNGEGAKDAYEVEFTYPPLWGEHSYNVGAGLFRLSSFAGYVKSNMPFDEASHKNPKLSDEDAWDLAAYVNSQPRPQKDLSKDWPDISKKPFDHPFGPYTDGFSETQHKYGPFKPIVDKKNESLKNK